MASILHVRPPVLARPVKKRRPTQHLITLSRLTRSVEIDESLNPRRRRRLLQLLAQAIGELQKEIAP